MPLTLIYIRPRVKTNDVIVRQQIGESERIKISHLIRRDSIYCSLHAVSHQTVCFPPLYFFIIFENGVLHTEEVCAPQPFQGCNCLLSLADFVFGGVTMAVCACVPGPLVVGISVGRSLSLAATLVFILLVCRLLVPRDFVFLGLDLHCCFFVKANMQYI